MMAARALPKPALRPFLPHDLPLIADIFRASIAELTGDDYDERQQEAWASAADDQETFAARLANAVTLLASIEGSPVGFASLAGIERLDMLYVHPAAAGQGVGSMLIDAIEKLAKARGAKRLVADVSDSAQDFFRHRGFLPRQRNSVTVGNQWVANTTMEKQLVGKGPTP
jgi:putative acetyltransferase